MKFLRDCRCVLGTSSGASVVDFTGEIRRACERHLALRPDASYPDVKARFFADADWKVVIDTVSPRVFEAAALGCTLVQHEGLYGGILRPDEHYICVRRDYSNAADVIDRVQDRGFCREMAERTHRDLIASAGGDRITDVDAAAVEGIAAAREHAAITSSARVKPSCPSTWPYSTAAP